MTNLKYPVLLSIPVIFTGCKMTEFIVEKEAIIQEIITTATGVGPKGAIAGLGLSAVLGVAKWFQHKSTTKDLVKGIQKAKDELDPKAKEMFASALEKYLPSKVKKAVEKIKSK